MSRYSYWGFKPQPTVWERQQKAAKTIARMRKKGADLSPVQLEGRTIAKTFWGKAWCDNIESYRDFAYRLERGRSYVRSGAVIDLKISEGAVGALVIGSGRSPYEVIIRIDKMKKPDWDALVKRSSGKISSLMALAQGKLPKEMLEDFCNPETGLFPKPREIHFDCACPDGASCCKHVAAVLYGIGARLDEKPELFFTLRGIDQNSIVSAEVVDTLTDGAASELDGADLGDVFGIALDEDGGENGREGSDILPSMVGGVAPCPPFWTRRSASLPFQILPRASRRCASISAFRNLRSARRSALIRRLSVSWNAARGILRYYPTCPQSNVLRT